MKYIGVDIESVGLKGHGIGIIWMLSITDLKGTQVYHNCNGMTLKDIPSSVLKDLRDPTICKIIHSSQFDCPYIEHVWGLKIENVFDTELCETVIQGMRYTTQTKNIEPGSALDKMMRQHSVQLKYTLMRYKLPVPDKEIRKQFIDRPKGISFTKEEIKYAAMDTQSLLKLQKYQEVILKRDGLMEVALLENLVALRYHDMKVRGIKFDRKRWKELAEFYKKEFDKRMSKLPKEVDNWNSEKQVKAYFYKKGILIKSYKEMDEVYLSTRNKVLGDFIIARELAKAVSSYGHSWFTDGYIDSDDRIRANITQIINTARNSMNDPNLQQLPGKGNVNYVHLRVMEIIRQLNKIEKLPWLHRECFIPEKGNVFIDLDFSGQEIGIMAAMADEKLWIDALLRNEDVHGLTASIIDMNAWQAAKQKECTFPKKCNCPDHKELREPAKINNFRLAYGGGALSFAKATGRSELSAIAYTAAHKRAIPRLTRTLDLNGLEAMKTGVAYTADPYKRRFVLMADEPWQVRNMGKNYPIQGAGANCLKLALVSLPSFIPVVLVIHDQIIVEAPKNKAKEWGMICKKVMEDAADYITSIKGLIKVTPEIKVNVMKDGGIPITDKDFDKRFKKLKV